MSVREDGLFAEGGLGSCSSWLGSSRAIAERPAESCILLQELWAPGTGPGPWARALVFICLCKVSAVSVPEGLFVNPATYHAEALHSWEHVFEYEWSCFRYSNDGVFDDLLEIEILPDIVNLDRTAWRRTRIRLRSSH